MKTIRQGCFEANGYSLWLLWTGLLGGIKWYY